MRLGGTKKNSSLKNIYMRMVYFLSFFPKQTRYRNEKLYSDIKKQAGSQ